MGVCMKYHFYKIQVDSKYFYRILNNVGNISLTNLNLQDEIFSFDISFKDIKELIIICERCQIPILDKQEFGTYTKIVKRSVMNTLAIVIMIFMLLLIINSLFIWNITIDGNYTNSSDEIVLFINKTVKCGALKVDVNTEQLEKDLRNEFDNVSWVCAEIKGTNLIVHVKETYLSEIIETEDKPYNIIANKAGTIKSIITRQGVPNAKIGDKVKKGDILISGKVVITSEFEEELFTNFYSADGTITAQTTHKINETLEKEYTKKEIKNTYSVYLPTINNYSWQLKINNKSVAVERSNFKLWGDFYLPIVVEKYTIEKADYKKAEYTKQEAENILNNKLLYKLSKMEQKGYKILKNNVKIVEEENCFKLVGKIQCIEPIGKVEYIDVEKELEEGTTRANERN